MLLAAISLGCGEVKDGLVEGDSLDLLDDGGVMEWPVGAQAGPQAPAEIDADAESTEAVPPFLGRPGAPYLDVMDEGQVLIAVELANEQLEEDGYGVRVDPVTVYQGTVEQISFFAGVEVYGWTPGALAIVGLGDVCGFPDDYDGRRLGWVLSHELLHTVGFGHGAQMTALTNALGARWRDYCEDGDAGVL